MVEFFLKKKKKKKQEKEILFEFARNNLFN